MGALDAAAGRLALVLKNDIVPAQLGLEQKAGLDACGVGQICVVGQAAAARSHLPVGDADRIRRERCQRGQHRRQVIEERVAVA